MPRHSVWLTHRQDRDTVGVAIKYDHGVVGNADEHYLSIQTVQGLIPVYEINLRDVKDPNNPYIIEQHIPEGNPRGPYPGAPPYYGNGQKTTFIYAAEEGQTYDVELVVRRPSISGLKVNSSRQGSVD